MQYQFKESTVVKPLHVHHSSWIYTQYMEALIFLKRPSHGVSEWEKINLILIDGKDLFYNVWL